MSQWDAPRTWRVLADVAIERERQSTLFPGQESADKPDGTSEEYKALADKARDACEALHQAGEGTWFSILAEEFWEAAAEKDWPALRKELVQVAAVAVKWVEIGDLRE